MRMTKLAVIAAVVLAVAGVAVAAALLLGRSDEPGTDAHARIDPITTADEVAVAVMAGVHTWTPAEQQSPWDAMHAISDRLTGRMADAAATRPEPDPTPQQWDAWARSGDRVVGATEVVDGQQPTPGAVEAQRVVRVQQKVLHPDGATTPLEPITVVVELRRVDQQWKAENYRYQAGR